jgi:hypothetical protein
MSTTTAAGEDDGVPGLRAKCMPNFRAEDDLWLAEAYAAVTVDAAVGTDQNGATFWGKIRDGYIEKGGSAGRTAVSLQNRFNRYLQTDVNKYIGMLTSTFREYHSGWSLQDYYNDAKRRYVCKYLKPFKFEDVWTVLKENLVKFQIPSDVMDSRVQRALFFCDDDNNDDNAGACAGTDKSEEAVRSATAVSAAPVQRFISAGVGMCTPRPTMGKKKAKAVAYGNKNITSKKQKSDAEASKNNVVLDAATTHRNNSIAVLAETAKKKNDLVEQEFAYKLFERFPHTAEADAFFAEMRKKYLEKYTGTTTGTTAGGAAVLDEGQVVPADSPTSTDDSSPASNDSPTTDNSPAASNDDVDDEESNVNDDDGSYIDAQGLYVPGGFVRDKVLDNWMGRCAPPIDLSQEESLPPTQCLVLALQRNENVQDVVDSQLTMLE